MRIINICFYFLIYISYLEKNRLEIKLQRSKKADKISF